VSAYHTWNNLNLTIFPYNFSQDHPGWFWDHYNPTPVMPPTIIAMIVSEYASETAQPDLFNPAKPVKIWGPPPMMQNGEAKFAAEAAAKQIKFLQDYWGIEYELPKLDSAAIPDFAAGAMENWVTKG
jgi:aminopeptidase N